MDTILDNSPYRCGDPTLARTNLEQLAHACWGEETRPDPALVACLPCTPIPVITPAGAANDRQRGGILFTTPFPYLPAEIWMRRPGEHAGGYQMRLLLALDALDLYATDDDGIWYADNLALPDSADAIRSIAAAFDGLARNDAFDAIRDDYARRAAGAWPDGYPADGEIANSRQLAALCMRGSAVLAGQRALALAAEPDADARRHSIEILKAAKTEYGPLFADDMTPDGIRTWVNSNRTAAFDMLDQLAAAGLEAKATADAAREVFAQ